MTSSPPESSSTSSQRLLKPPKGIIGSLIWMGPMLMLLGAAIGSGELLAEPAAGARHGSSLLWAILFIVVTKAFWNEVIGRVGIVTGQNFLESCFGAGRLMTLVPVAWYVVNGIKDFLLRGGITAIAGLICYDMFGPLPLPAMWLDASGNNEQLQTISWTLLNYGLIWLLLVAGGYRLAEMLNTVLSLVFTLCLVACAVAVLPQATGELARGLVPRIPSGGDELLMLVSLAGIVMSGSTTVYYSAWAEERKMGLFNFVRGMALRLTREQAEPESKEEVERMMGWVRVNRLNVIVTYLLGALICLSTFVLGVAVLRPAGVTLTGAKLAPELSLMMTSVAGDWARPVFYLGAYAAVVSTAIGILDGGSRMYIQPLRARFPNVSIPVCQRVIMTVMVVGCWSVYVLVPDALKLVIWMGAIDAPLVGILFLAYAYLGKRYLPQVYRYGTAWTVAMALTGILYFGLGVFFVVHRIMEFMGTGV